MRWLSFTILVVIAITLQTTVAPRLALWGVKPDWLIVVVIFLSLHAPKRESAIAGFLIGLSADLMTIERFGLLAITYLLVALLVTAVRDYLFRLESLTQFLLTLSLCGMVRFAWLIYSRWVYDPIDGFFLMFGRDVCLTAIYTALWAPVFHSLLFKLNRLLGLPRPRYTYAGKITSLR